MAEHKILYLSRVDVETVDLPMKQSLDLLEKAFLEKRNGRVEMPPAAKGWQLRNDTISL